MSKLSMEGLFAFFDRAIWALNFIAPFPRLSQVSISPATGKIQFMKFLK